MEGKGSSVILMAASFKFHSRSTAAVTSRVKHQSTPKRVMASNSGSFDVSRYEAERLQLDDQARSMMAKASSEALPGAKEGAWKWHLRNSIWTFMERNDIAR